MKRLIAAAALLTLSASAFAGSADMAQAISRYNNAKQNIQGLPVSYPFLAPVVQDITGETSATTDRMIVSVVANGKTCEDLKQVVSGRMAAALAELPFKKDDSDSKAFFVELTVEYVDARCALLTTGIIK
ncbi:hypothetical protein AB6T85_23625 [Erwinia sp. ACCC 02193]|uniref:Uncharacterized protein n=1 Tax=Erwinia aeris TaxID=3239803 RepID=A0ABV4EEP4_9GAMM